MSCPGIKCGDFILKLDLGEPSEKAKRKALEELRETPENVRNGLKELKKLLEDQLDLNIPRTSDEWLIKYLRCCKFYPESARDLIKRCYILRRKYSEITKLMHLPKLKHVFEANVQGIMPQRDQEGRRILITHGGKHWNYKLVPRDDAFSSSILCSDMVQMEPETQINGVIYLLDLQGLSFRQSLQFTPYCVKRLLDFLQDNNPLRVKGFHVVNQPQIFQPIFNAAKIFFSSKFSHRVFLHGSNFESLHKYIAPEFLPECYGGTLKCEAIYGRETYELMKHYESHIESWAEYGFI